jgi:hypothetical protein
MKFSAQQQNEWWCGKRIRCKVGTKVDTYTSTDWDVRNDKLMKQDTDQMVRYCSTDRDGRDGERNQRWQRWWKKSEMAETVKEISWVGCCLELNDLHGRWHANTLSFYIQRVWNKLTYLMPLVSTRMWNWDQPFSDSGIFKTAVHNSLKVEHQTLLETKVSVGERNPIEGEKHIIKSNPSLCFCFCLYLIKVYSHLVLGTLVLSLSPNTRLTI